MFSRNIKLNAKHLFLILLAVLILCSIFTYKMIEGLTGRGGDTDTPVDSQTLEPKDVLMATLPTADEVNKYDPTLISPAQIAMGTTSTAQSALPNGIPASEIPAGQEDLYIKKSEVVPPVCPACPSSSVCPREKPCPPCPPCARCPEPAFECKKVPNYAAQAARTRDQYMLGDLSYTLAGKGDDFDTGKNPMPILTDFSEFGM